MTEAELTVLGLLVEHPRHGYELERVIEERGVRSWTALGFSSIYYVLDKLAARGLIEPTGDRAGSRSRTPYRATPAGRAECASATRAALETLTPLRAGVLVGMANSPALPPAEVAAGLTVRLAALRAKLAEVHRTRAAQEPLPPPAAAIFDYSETMLRAEITWTESTVERSAP